MNARFDARAEADASVWARPDQSSNARNTPSVNSTPSVSPAMTGLRTTLVAESFLIGQRTLAPNVAVVARRFEDMARGHLAAVNVERDRRRR